MATLDELLALLPDNNTGEIDAADMRAIVTALWQRASTGTLAGTWQFNSTAGATPGGGQVTTSSGDAEQATWIRFATFDDSYTDMTLALVNATGIIAQQRSNATNRAVWTVTGDAVEGEGYVEVPVTFVSADGEVSMTGWQSVQFVFAIGAAS